MEPQELINERNELFESLKIWFSKSAKVRSIAFVIFCLLTGLCIFSAIIGHIDWFIGIVCCIIFLVAGIHDMIWYPKLAKANDAQEFLTIYDKKRKIEKWTTLICTLLIIAFIIVPVVISKVDIKIFLLPGALLCLVLAELWDDPRKRDIERLRELVQQS